MHLAYEFSVLWKVFLVPACILLGDLEHVLEAPLAGSEQLLLDKTTAEDTPRAAL